jgi:hypothetical protein
MSKRQPVVHRRKNSNSFWEKDGIKRYTTEFMLKNIQLLGKRSDLPEEPSQAVPTPEPFQETSESVEDDLPF